MPTLTEYPRIDVGDGIKRFADSHLQESIRAAVSQLPDDKHIAVVAFANTNGDARLATVARLGKHWSAVGVLEHGPGEKWAGEVSVMWSA